MAEGLIRSRLTRDGLADHVRVGSAGTWADDGMPPTAHAVAAMEERGIDIRALRAREIDAAEIEAADLVLAMTDGQRVAIETEFPAARGKTRLMSSLAGSAWDVSDPIGGGLEDYRATANELARLVDAGWAIIVGDEADCP